MSHTQKRRLWATREISSVNYAGVPGAIIRCNPNVHHAPPTEDRYARSTPINACSLESRRFAGRKAFISAGAGFVKIRPKMASGIYEMASTPFLILLTVHVA